MKALKKCLVIVIFLVGKQLLFSQEEQIDMELLLQESSVDLGDYDTQTEHLSELLQKPIKLNKVDAFELEESGLFNTQQINSFLAYRDSLGKLISLYELQAIPHFEPDFIRKILPFVLINSDINDFKIPFGKLISKGTYQIFLRYQQSFPSKQGYDAGRYLGSPSKIYTRYKYNYSNKFSYGITAEKDAGETMFKENSKTGFDFYSYHLFWKINSKWRAVALGDYQINFGQALVIWTGFSFNKSANASLTKKESSTLKPFTSVNEYAFLRGAAFNFHKNKFQSTVFLSYKAIDGNISYVDTSTTDIESNRIQFSGYHRTESEIAAKNANKELLTGFNVQLKQRNRHLGYNLVLNHFQKEINFDTKVYNQFQFRGKTLMNQSLDYHLLHKNFHFFGEEALSISKNQVGYAFLNGLIFNPDKHLDFSLVHRYYSVLYQSNNYVNAFGEGSLPNNEHGIYLGMKWQLLKKVQVSSYFDLYTFPWLRYQSKMPTIGNDFLLNINYKISKSFECYLSYKRETKAANTNIDLGENNSFESTEENRPYLLAYFGENAFDENQVLRPSKQLSKQEIEAAKFIVPIQTQSLRLHLSYSLNKTWTFQTRLQLNSYKDVIHPRETGFMAYQDLSFQKLACPFGFSTRLAFFDVGSYNSRVYSYESDVLFQFSIPALYHRGIRYYVNLNYRLTKNLQVWLRFSHTYYNGIDEFGTGNDLVQANKLYDIKMQMRLKF